MDPKRIMADKLPINVYDNREAMGAAAAEDAARRLNAVIKAKGHASAVFAAAPSQNEFLAHLKASDVDWTKVSAYHMDEYIGLRPDAPQGFGNFLRRALFDELPFACLHFLSGGTDSEKACEEYTRLLRADMPDIVFMGIGENGHLAFNDPPVADFDDPLDVKVVKLDETCRVQQVHDGCFAKIEDVPMHAVTLTMSFLMRIPSAVVIVPGKSKAAALEKTANAPILTDCPATILRTHRDAALYADRDAASLLGFDPESGLC